MGLAMPPAAPEPAVSSEWETWRGENTIELCEVNITVQGYLLSMYLIAYLSFSRLNIYRPFDEAFTSDP